MKKNVLVFPCGSEIALEIYKSLKYSTYFNLIGASSVDDHGKFIYENYIGDIPYITDENFIEVIKKLVKEFNIDYIYPAMDTVISKLKNSEDELGCYVVSSSKEVTDICLSKRKTYEALQDTVRVPHTYKSDDNITFPVFCKPDIGYGSRGAMEIKNQEQLVQYVSENKDCIISECLSGEEYTVDCFTDRNGQLLFAQARIRGRIMNGISVNTVCVSDNKEFYSIANAINNELEFRGAWFVQLKQNTSGELVLLEIASRFGGSSGIHRANGINFAQLSLFDAMGYPVSILNNECSVEMDRALDCKVRINTEYNEVFIDFDDTIIIDEKYYNTDAVRFLYDCKNRGIKITLLSSHDGDLVADLDKYQIKHLFDRIIHINKKDHKGDFIDNKKSIFIDDSFAERKNVLETARVPVFSVDMISLL